MAFWIHQKDRGLPILFGQTDHHSSLRTDVQTRSGGDPNSPPEALLAESSLEPRPKFIRTVVPATGLRCSVRALVVAHHHETTGPFHLHCLHTSSVSGAAGFGTRWSSGIADRMRKPHILTWLRPYRGLPAKPEKTPFGRAALALRAQGVDVLLASSASSWSRAEEGRWVPAEPVRVDAIYDRFASRSLPERYAQLEAQSSGVLRANPPGLIRLCSDKVETQRVLHSLPFPAIESNPHLFQERLEAWGRAFLKPRFGGLGRGISMVQQGDSLPAWGQGAVKGASEPTFLQQAVLPPKGTESLCVRWLIQRDSKGTWSALPPVARLSSDPVANVHQGARALPAEEALPPVSLRRAEVLVHEAAEALQALYSEPVVELGVDLVFDAAMNPWILEINSRPSGRFQALASLDPVRFQGLADQAVLRPLQRLAALC